MKKMSKNMKPGVTYTAALDIAKYNQNIEADTLEKIVIFI